jgi:hypothetical protein
MTEALQDETSVTIEPGFKALAISVATASQALKGTEITIISEFLTAPFAVAW